jgi:hypothetical protein
VTLCTRLYGFVVSDAFRLIFLWKKHNIGYIEEVESVSS